MKFISLDIVLMEEKCVSAMEVNSDSLSAAMFPPFNDEWKADSTPDDHGECDCGSYLLQCCKTSLYS